MEVAKIFFKTQIVYRFDVSLTALSVIWRVMFAYIMWGAIFDGRETVGGFTFQAMLSYYVISSFLAAIDTAGVSGEVSARIRGGTFAKYMVIPTHPLKHFLAQTFGAAGYYAIFSIIAAIACALLFRVDMMFSENPAQIALAGVMIIAGTTFMVSYHFFIGILAFKFQDVGFFLHLQGSVIEFATGAAVPLALLPVNARAVLRFLPFTYVTYMPAMLITGQAEASEGVFGLSALCCWAAVMAVICCFTYNRLRVRFDGVGI
jgi:ABC-2 type transport system permease protein